MEISLKTEAVMFLNRASIHLELPIESKYKRDYHDRKSSQLLSLETDLLIAEVGIEGWLADLGTIGCCG